MALLADFEPRRVVYAGTVGDRWFVSSVHDAQLVALNEAGEATERWQMPVSVERVLEVGGRLLALHGHRSAYDVATGQRVWHLESELRGLTCGGRRAIGVAADRALDLLTGETLWMVEASQCGVTFDDERVYLLRKDGLVLAHARADGHELWRFMPPTERRFDGYGCGQPVIFDGALWYAARRGFLVRLDRSTGSVVAEYSLGHDYTDHLVPTPGALLVKKGAGPEHSDVKVVTPAGGIETRVAFTIVKAFAGGGEGYALLGAGKTPLLWAPSPDGELRRVELARDWDDVRVDAGHVIVSTTTRLLRFALSERAFTRAAVANPMFDPHGEVEPATVIFAGPELVVAEHATRGRFTMRAANTGLAKGAAISIGGFVPGPMNMVFATKLEYVLAGRKVVLFPGQHQGLHEAVVCSGEDGQAFPIR